MATVPRVAFFPDCFHEVNGVALTSRQFGEFAHRRRLPFLKVHGGSQEQLRQDGSVTTLELDTSPASVRLDADLHFDLLFLRWHAKAREVLRKFRPDLIHVTSPGHFGLLGALLASELKLPLVASWHTNVHEFGARRLEKILSFIPDRLRHGIGSVVEGRVLDGALHFYRFAKHLFAPNDELAALLKRGTRKPVSLMQRGVDTRLFHPGRRNRSDGAFVLGFVGRIRPEKNVRFLVELEKRLRAAGVRNYRFLVVGQGTERDWLRDNLQQGELPGVLKGRRLARAYANMDLFVFPSLTDTFGNVVQEALASGVPAVVTNSGGPKYLVRDGQTGFVTHGDDEFCGRVIELIGNPALHYRMREAARASVLDCSWDNVFEQVYRSYKSCLAA